MCVCTVCVWGTGHCLFLIWAFPSFCLSVEQPQARPPVDYVTGVHVHCMCVHKDLLCVCYDNGPMLGRGGGEGRGRGEGSQL